MDNLHRAAPFSSLVSALSRGKQSDAECRLKCTGLDLGIAPLGAVLALVLISLTACQPPETPATAQPGNQDLTTEPAAHDDIYLGLEPPGMTPEVFSPEVLSKGESDVCTGFLNNGSVFVFKQLSPDLDWKFEPIYFTELKHGKWTAPAVTPFSDLYPYNYTVAPDGRTLYFTSLRSVEDRSKILRQADVWRVEKTAEGWSEPETFGAPVNSENHFENYPSITADGTLYFMSYRDEGMGEDDIYRLQLVNGNYVELENWTEPVNMGEGINSAGAEFRPSVTPDGEYFFFTSDRSGVGEIYWVDAEIIQSMMPPAGP